MKALRIYVDTNVIGGCCDPEFSKWSEGLMNDFAQGYYCPVISDIVAAEIAGAPAEVLDKYAKLLECGPEFVTVTQEIQILAASYVQRGILSPNFSDDALHIALATVADVDVLVSWNFRHIVHVEKMRLFNAANLEQGYKPLQICSPREVTYHGD